jgi:hypothetical protein
MLEQIYLKLIIYLTKILKGILEAMKSWHIILEVSQYSLDPNHSDFLAELH